MHLSFASPWVDPRDTPAEPTGTQGAVAQFCYFFFPREGEELFSFGNDFAGPRGHTHGICSRQCDMQGEQCFTWYHSRCMKMRKKSAKRKKKTGYICLLFLPMKSKYYTLVRQLQVEEGCYVVLDNY